MGLNRELREINRQILTDKQEKQLARQERQQLKNLQLVDQAHKKTLQLFIKSKIQYFLELNFNKYKSELYLLSLKNEIQQDFIKKNKGYEDIIFIYFDDFYYKELKKQIAIYTANQKALPPPQPTPEELQQLKNQQVKQVKKEVIILILKSCLRFFATFIFLIFNFVAIIAAPMKSSKRRF